MTSTLIGSCFCSDSRMSGLLLLLMLPLVPLFMALVGVTTKRRVQRQYELLTRIAGHFLDLMRGEDESTEFHRDFYDEYNAVLDMPAEYYLDTIRVVFQDFALVNGTWHVNGKLVRPQDITTGALLTVEGELDDISGAGQTRAAHGLCTGIPTSRQFHYDVDGAGHYGIFSGRRWREKVYTKVRDFIASHQGAAGVAKAPAKKAARRAAR